MVLSRIYVDVANKRSTLVSIRVVFSSEQTILASELFRHIYQQAAIQPLFSSSFNEVLFIFPDDSLRKDVLQWGAYALMIGLVDMFSCQYN